MFNSSISILVMVTLICVSIIVFSLIHLGNFLMAWVGGFENGTEWQIASLSLMIVLSMAFLASLIKGVSNGSFLKKAATLEKLTSLNIQNLACQFTSGIIEGFTANQNQPKKTNTNP